MTTVTVAPDTVIFFQLPEEAEAKILHPCNIREIAGDIHTLVAAEAMDGVESDQTALVYFEQNREFMQQVVQVVSAEREETGFVMQLEFIGDPVSAEQRQSYRVSCLALEISATVAGEQGCNVVDISATGFAVYSTQTYSLGHTTGVELHHDGASYPGTVAVQSVRPMSGNQFRYGVRAMEDRRGETLEKSLNKINMAIQREQMRRV